MEQHKVTAVIVTHNSRELLPYCMRGLKEDGYPKIEVVVVDCCSTDGTPELVRKLKPEAHVVTLPNDPGYAAACLVGARLANSEFILWLNTDVVLTKGTIARLVQACEGGCDVASAVQYTWDGRLANWGNPFPGFPRWLARILSMAIKRDPGQPFYVGSACSLVKKSVFQLVPFDPDLAFYEDFDWGWRLWIAGYKQSVVADAIVFHRTAAQLSSSMKLARVYGRNLFLGPIVCAPFWMAVLVLPGIAFFWLSLVQGYMRDRTGRGRILASIRGLTDIPLGIDKWQEKRREAMSMRRVPHTLVFSALVLSRSTHESRKRDLTPHVTPPGWLDSNKP